MLFDLRARGRRRTVQIVYLGLAILIGVGLVGFGIGGGFGSGGIFNSVSNNGGGGGTSSFSSEIKRDRRLTQQQPSNPNAWATLARHLYLEAGTGSNYNNATGQFTASARPVLSEAANAWQTYLQLNPTNPSPDLAKMMVFAYVQGGINDPKNEVRTLQIVLAANPNDLTSTYELAVAAYQAGDTREAALAASKALRLAPASGRPALRQALNQAKANGPVKPTTTTK